MKMSTPDADEPLFVRYLFREEAGVATLDLGGVSIERRALGFVDIPDGSVDACDPLVPMDTLPFAHRLAPGKYEAVLFVAVALENPGPDFANERTVAAALMCGSTRPERWELAAREGVPADASAYGVDSGTGCFAGTQAMDRLENADETCGVAIIAALERAPGAVVSVDGSHVAVFASGIGDGIYDTWLGRDERGELSLILTDFGGLESSENVARIRAEIAARRAKKWWQFWK